MKKMLAFLAVIGLVVGTAQADTYSYNVSQTSLAVTVSAALPVSGWLDKIEISHAGAGQTSTVVVATYDAASNAVDTIATASGVASKVIRTRVIGTSNAGVDLAAAYGVAQITNVTQQLVANYERILIGGNVKATVTGAGVTAGTNNCTVTFYYEPLKK